MNEDDLTKTLGSSLTRLTWTVNLWGAAITILLATILVLSGTTIRGHSL
jgi:cell division protein FtsX